MQATRADFAMWRTNPFTVAVALDIAEVSEEMAAELINRRGSNPSDDQWIKGYLSGVRALLDWEPEFIEEKNNAQD